MPGKIGLFVCCRNVDCWLFFNRAESEGVRFERWQLLHGSAAFVSLGSHVAGGRSKAATPDCELVVLMRSPYLQPRLLMCRICPDIDWQFESH
jgi:hypothetical protein